MRKKKSYFNVCKIKILLRGHTGISFINIIFLRNEIFEIYKIINKDLDNIGNENDDLED